MCLPDAATSTLRHHRAAQAQERLTAGPHWDDELDLVFTTTVGTPIDPANLRRTVRAIAASAGITKPVNPYDLRRTAISLLSHVGVPGERVADIAGNDAKTAMSIYRRPVAPVVEYAAEPMDNLGRDHRRLPRLDH
ncbi:tyrosine-type recombinase/integrase [Iamia sp.]|uniref:tyrosine-type recombinase/integrase n=1 Tax=Iamia sp. TaxID=2722710 RepID=UPI002B8C1E3F|nr:tyrosine-type recombinase/integrase [Iamia sp.]HXH56189.1 tyrosine-type recombinase/integrase [Iamia sp.]